MSNSITWFSLGLLIASSASFAASRAPKPLAEAQLRYETALHVRGERTLVMTAHDVYVDGFRLSVPERIAKRDFITRALAAQKSGIVGTCPAGTYSLSVTIHGEMSVENGCLDSPRFAEAIFSMDQLRTTFPDDSGK